MYTSFVYTCTYTCTGITGGGGSGDGSDGSSETCDGVDCAEDAVRPSGTDHILNKRTEPETLTQEQTTTGLNKRVLGIRAGYLKQGRTYAVQVEVTHKGVYDNDYRVLGLLGDCVIVNNLT